VVFQLIKFSLKLQDDFALSVISDFSCWRAPEKYIKKASKLLAFLLPVERLSSPVVFILFAPVFYQVRQICILVIFITLSIKNQLR